MRIFILTIFIFLLSLVSCENPPGEPKGKVDNAMAYYFPIDELRDTKVYHYTPTKGDVSDMYWVLSVYDTLGKTIFNTTAYFETTNNKVRKGEWVKEEITANSSFIHEYMNYFYDNFGNKTRVRSRNTSTILYKNEIEKNTSFIWSYSAIDINSVGVKFEVKKRRTYTGNSSQISFNNQQIDALVFKDEFIIRKIKNETDVLSVEDFYQYSYYAKGIGLYKYKRFSEDGTFEYQLNHIYKIDDPRLPETIRKTFN